MKFCPGEVSRFDLNYKVARHLAIPRTKRMASLRFKGIVHFMSTPRVVRPTAGGVDWSFSDDERDSPRSSDDEGESDDADDECDIVACFVKKKSLVFTSERNEVVENIAVHLGNFIRENHKEDCHFVYNICNGGYVDDDGLYRADVLWFWLPIAEDSVVDITSGFLGFSK